MAVHRVLLVCEQNVCRSPYLAAVVNSLLAGDDRHTFVVASRGTTVTAGAEICSVAERNLRGHGISVGVEHGSTALEQEDVVRADLILTATERQRSAIALLSPGARVRAYTVREAILLSERELGADELARVRVASRRSSLREFASAINARRGTLDLPGATVRPRLGGRRAAPDSPLDIPDHHRTGGQSHRRLFDEMYADAGVLAARIKYVLETP
ncbi:hypothetical protein [Microbacterium sp. P03]|uniref:arsenate reductase/protein-tyrosine-phosphatase family protein n=1 Tax=Microbacterium sp. P03 TaxID=3366946 RepID=UPI0037452E0C